MKKSKVESGVFKRRHKHLLSDMTLIESMNIEKYTISDIVVIFI